MPVNGSGVVWNFAGSAGNPAGYDDIANLYLETVALTSVYLAIGAALTVGTLASGPAEPDQIFSDTLAGTGAVTYVNATTDPGEQYFALENGELVLSAAPISSSYLEYSNQFSTATLAFKTLGGTVAAHLTGLEVGDRMALPGTSVSSVTYGASSMTIVTNLGTTTFSNVSYGTLAPTGYTVGTDAVTGEQLITFTTPCYATGTRLRTARGEVAVEDLRAGDLVASAFGGMVAVVWIGHRQVNCRRHPKPVDVWPVRVAAGAFDAGLPHRDLVLSPDHAVYINDVLVPIRYLINGATIAQQPTDTVTYWHVELPAHDVMFAEGLPAESYLDTGNRAAFANGGAAPIMLHPDFALRVWEAESCAPLVYDGAILAASRATLLARAEILGHEITCDADLHLLVDGRIVRPISTGTALRFVVNGPAATVHLVSRHTVPAWHHEIDDHRQLGVAISRLAVNGQTLALDDPRLGDGWHALETDAAPLRWTDGNAALALAGDCVLDVELGLAARYWLPAGAAPAADRVKPLRLP